jgi:hypothetical protein
MLPNTNKVEVKLRYGELSTIIQWCERNCSEKWAYEQLSPAGNIAGEYEFYFESEKDLVAFKFWKS